MKSSPVLFFFLLLGFGCNSKDVMTELLNEQRSLKDSVNNIRERIGGYLETGAYESVKAEQKHIGAVYARLTDIQLSIDSLVSIDSPGKMKQ